LNADSLGDFGRDNSRVLHGRGDTGSSASIRRAAATSTLPCSPQGAAASGRHARPLGPFLQPASGHGLCQLSRYRRFWGCFLLWGVNFLYESF
jgi:hypothetical protein